MAEHALQHVAHLVCDAGHDLADRVSAAGLLDLRMHPQRLLVGALELAVRRGEVVSAATVSIGQHRRENADDVEHEQVEDGHLPHVGARRAHELQQAERLRARHRQKRQRRDHGHDDAGHAREHDARVHGDDRVDREIGRGGETARRIEPGGDESDVHDHADPGLQSPAPVRACGEVVGHVHEEPEHGGHADEALHRRRDGEDLVEAQHQQGDAGSHCELLVERSPPPSGVGRRRRRRQ